MLDRKTSIAIQIATASAVLAVAILLNPYVGIRHDSILYLGQALRDLYPAQLDQDLFFHYGSQTDFSIFSVFIAKLLQEFAVGPLFVCLALISRVAFVGASWLLIRSLFPSRLRVFAMIAVVTLPSNYGSTQIFSYSESFFTARSIAEPLTLLALAIAYKKRYALAVTTLVFGTLFHPLQILPAVLVIFFLPIGAMRARIIVLVMLALFSVSLIFASVAIQQRVLLRIDPEWFQWLRGPSDHLFMSHWAIKDWGYLCTDFFLVALYRQVSTGSARRFATVVLLTAATCAAISLLFLDHLQFAIFGALQLWRSQWLLHWLAMAAIPPLLLAHLSDSKARTTLWIFIFICATGISFHWDAPATLGVPLVLIVLYLGLVSLKPTRTFRCVVYSVVVALSVLLTAGTTNDIYLYYKTWGFQSITLISVLICVSLIVFLFTNKARSTAILQGVAIFLCISSVCTAVFMWDRRDPQVIASEQISLSSDDHTNSFNSFPLNAQLLVPNAPLGAWLWLHHPNYLSQPQLAGIIFNRRTASEGFARIAQLTVVDKNGPCTATSLKKELPSLPQCSFDYSVVRQICSNTKLYDLYILLSEQIELPRQIEYGPNIFGKRIQTNGFSLFVYQCALINSV